MKSALCFTLLLLLFARPTWAQSRDITRAETRVAQDGVISGRLDANRTRDVFYVDGLRGEVIRFELQATEGDLDPVLSVFDDNGALELHRDDSAAGFGSAHDLTIKTSGRYYVVVGRFGYDLGSTAGSYELRMTRRGVVSERGSTLRYGDSVIGTISDTTAEVYYTFQAQQGDILTISMVRSSGTLDPYLRVVDGERFVIAENDDQVGADTRNARVDALVVQSSGTYIIVATRYDDSSGSFVLSIEEAENSGSGSSRLAPLPISYGESRTAALSHGQYERSYSFQAEKDDLITITMVRGDSGDLDSFVILTDAEFVTLIEDDDGGGNQNARISDFRIPAAGRYHLVATRFEGSRGKTSGEFQLSLDIIDNPFVDVPAGSVSLNYGTSVTGKISADNEQDIYAFYGRQGEVVTIAMTRVDGDLDAFLELLDGTQQVVTSNDDGGNGQNALINNYPLPTTGTYFVRARRYAGTSGNPNTAGSYVLVLAERPN